MVSKSQLAQRIAARGATSAQAAHAVDAVLGEITAALAAGEKVTLVGFGSFEPVARPARTARNPRTGASVEVPAATVPRFHPGAGLKAAVDSGEASLGPVGSLAEAVAAARPSAAPARAEVATGGKGAGKAAAKSPAKEAKPSKDAKPAKEAASKKDAKGKGSKGKKSGKKK